MHTLGAAVSKSETQHSLIRVRTTFLIACCVLLGLAQISSAQNNSGPNEGIWPTVASLSQYDSINLSNLIILVHVPVLQKIGAAALPFSFDVFVNNDVYAAVGGTVWAFGARNAFLGTGRIVGTNFYTTATFEDCDDGTRKLSFSGLAYGDSSGGIHRFSGTYHKCSPQSFSSLATDGSGYTIVVGATGTADVTVYSRSGNNANRLLQSTSLFPSELDASGNTVTLVTGSTSTYTDSLTQTALTQNTLPGWTGVGSSLSWTDVNSGNQAVTLASTTFNQKTVFGCSIPADVSGSQTFPSTATFPDGSVLTAKYEATPGNPGFYTGRISELDLPTGAQITYTYSGGTNGINCKDGTPHTLKRISPEGTWTYTHTPPASGNISTTIVVNPGNNETDYTYSGQFEVQRLMYQGCLAGTPGCVGSAGRTLVKTVLSCYNGNFTNCATANVALPITRADIYM